MTTPSSPDFAAAHQALAFYALPHDATLETLGGGLINQSFAVHTSRGDYVLQRVHPIFAPQIHENIRAVTEALARAGLETPRLIATQDGRDFIDLPETGRWRLMTRVPGVSFETTRSVAQAHAAGTFVARFHGALVSLRGSLKPLGFILHDPAQHLATLHKTLIEHPTHRLHSSVQALAKKIFAAAQDWDNFDSLPKRVVHGDLKLNNFVFLGATAPQSEQVVALVDLDTLSELPLYMELGDAWRSWCNPQGEDTREPQFDFEIFRASAQGYLEALPFELAHEERLSLAQAVERISLELATRFAVDALQENYFGWDASRFPAAGEHNLLRAEGQWALFEQARASRAARLQIFR